MYLKEPKSSLKWTEEEISILREKYPTTDIEKLAAMFNRTKTAIKLKARRIGVYKPVVHTQNNSYFEEINDHTKAYWVGFIAADGSVSHSVENGNYELRIELSLKDESHLIKFLEDIDSNNTISRRKKAPFKDRGYDNEYMESSARVYSKHVVESLFRYGIVPNKTHTMKFPDTIPDEYIWDYIRGFFDGDGSVFVRDVQSCSGRVFTYIGVNFTAYGKDFLLSIGDKLSEKGISSTINKSNKDGTAYQLYIRRQEDVARFFNLIYPSPFVRKLERKYMRFTDFYSEKLPA